MNLFRSQRETASDRRAYILTSRVLWAITAALLLVVAGLMGLSPMELRNSPLPLNVMTFAVFGPVALVYTYLRFDARVASLCDSVAVLSAFTIIGAAYTYLMTYLGAGVPFWDSRFLAADAALGLDWRSYLAWLNMHPLLGSALNSAYESILTQTAILIVLLVALGQHRRLQSFILAAQLCIIVCGAAAAVMPALGPYTVFEVTPAIDHPNIPLTVMNGPVAQILQLRGTAPFLQLDSIEGIIVFPSFHMALAILFAWAFWRVPFVRWIALILNIAVAAATPLSGAHYFVDVVGGAVVALAAIAMASSLARAVDRTASGREASGSPIPMAHT
jgi:hypothetical protein